MRFILTETRTLEYIAPFEFVGDFMTEKEWELLVAQLRAQAEESGAEWSPTKLTVTMKPT